MSVKTISVAISSPDVLFRRFFSYRLAVALDLLHMPLVFAFLVFGRLWLPFSLHTALVGTVVLLQMKFLACPLCVFTRHLKRQKYPDYDYWGTVTFRLYHQFGPWFGVPVFIIAIIVASGLRSAVVG